MLCLESENRLDCEKISQVGYADSRTVRSHPEVTVFNYGEDHVLVAATEDYRRTIPCFSNLSGALEMAHCAVTHSKIEESYLVDATKLPDGRVLTFSNNASFIVTEKLYQEMQKAIDEYEMSYSSAVIFMFNNCA